VRICTNNALFTLPAPLKNAKSADKVVSVLFCKKLLIALLCLPQGELCFIEGGLLTPWFPPTAAKTVMLNLFQHLTGQVYALQATAPCDYEYSVLFF
jgi:hypothetical protein